MKKFQITFVCLGNICRSPAAECILREKLKKQELSFESIIDSSGLGDYHIGNNADPRMITHAKKRGYEIKTKASLFNFSKDIATFDLIIAMDKSIYASIIDQTFDINEQEKLVLFTDYCTELIDYQGVPDPYYGEETDFELSLDIIEDGCNGIIEELKSIDDDFLIQL